MQLTVVAIDVGQKKERLFIGPKLKGQPKSKLEPFAVAIGHISGRYC